MNNQEKTLEEKLRELSLDELNEMTYKKIVLSLLMRDTMKGRMKGKVLNDKHKDLISKACKGRTLSDETKAKMSKAKKNMSYETKAKISKANIGKHQKKKRKRNDAQILEIKSKYATGKYTYDMLAKEYGVNGRTIFNYIKKKI